MAFLDTIRGLLKKQIPAELVSAGLTEEHMSRLRSAFEEEAMKPPKVAFLGETGVGKSLTINALFNEGQPISHEKACTQYETEVRGDRGGPLIIVDVPGVGEDIESDEKHIETYVHVLATVDVVIWILKADNRAMTNIQRALKQLVEKKALDTRHLVLGINQVDLVQPGSWDEKINQPSVEQEATIAARCKDIIDKVKRAVPLPSERIVPYSALKFYHLDELMTAMIRACEERRQWVLYDRASCADFMALVSPEVKEATP